MLFLSLSVVLFLSENLLLIKDKAEEVNIVNNCSGIILTPVASKLFEPILLEICEDFLLRDDKQFGLKRS